MKLRKAIPIIGAISSGKSFFVDSLLGLDILESESSITTKFVCIIQHHPELKEPRFYQINLEKQKTDENGIMEYEGFQKGNVVTGHKKIKDKIKEINRIQKDIPNEKIKYEELFYVLEIKVKTIKNEKLLNNYDFYDIPGLDEYIAGGDTKKQDNEKDKEKRMKYIENLFKYFHSRIDFGVFVINAESAYANSSKEVIVNVSKIIKPKILENYLIVLNKIDRQSEPNTTITNVKKILVNNVVNGLKLIK
jgi:Ca2+-binding EF-hand superfamily protein